MWSFIFSFCAPPPSVSVVKLVTSLTCVGVFDDCFAQEGADAGAAPNSIAHEDVRAMAEQKGSEQLQAANERLDNIVHPEIDADTADGGSSSSSSSSPA